MPHRRDFNQPSQDPALDTRAGPRPAPPPRTSQDTSTREGRAKPPTRARSERNGPGNAVPTRARPHPPAAMNECVSAHQSTAPALKTHRLREGCCQCPADMPSRRERIGQRCTDHHQHQPTLSGTSRGVHTIRTQGPQSKQTDSHLPAPKTTKPTPPVKSAQNAGTSHATSPPCARWRRPRHPYPAEPDTPHHPIASSVVRQPDNNPASSHRHRTCHSLTPPPAETVHQHHRLEPSPVTFPDERHTTGAQILKRHAMKGKRSERWRSTDHL